MPKDVQEVHKAEASAPAHDQNKDQGAALTGPTTAAPPRLPAFVRHS